MKLEWNYGRNVLVLPASVLEAEANEQQLKVLLWLAGDASLPDKPAQLAKLAGCTVPALKQALEFWKANGVLLGAESEKAARKPAAEAKAEAKKEEPSTEPKKEVLLRHADELPTYRTSELADLMEQRASLRVLVDESQRIFGKMLNTHEVNILFGMVDYLNLDEEYILILLAHCKRMDIKSMRQVEKYAISLMDDGITTAEELEKQIHKNEERHTLEGKVRSLFGMGTRAFSQKQKGMLANWISYGYGEDVIRMAYEVTANSIDTPTLAYTNSILERWHGEGMKTAEDVERLLEKERREKEGKGSGEVKLGNSFDTNDFFEAALERSFRDMEKSEPKSES